jgi:hypothetical protein
MTSARKRRRQITQLAAGPARDWPWVRVSRLPRLRWPPATIGSLSSFRLVTSEDVS